MLDGQISDYNHLLQQLNRLDQSDNSAEPPTGKPAEEFKNVDHALMTS